MGWLHQAAGPPGRHVLDVPAADGTAAGPLGRASAATARSPIKGREVLRWLA